MLTLTKKMASDLKKLKEDDLVVCEDCGSDAISEKITLPSHFLKANNIEKGCKVVIEGIINNSDAVKLKFKGVSNE